MSWYMPRGGCLSAVQAGVVRLGMDAGYGTEGRYGVC